MTTTPLNVSPLTRDEALRTLANLHTGKTTLPPPPYALALYARIGLGLAPKDATSNDDQFLLRMLSLSLAVYAKEIARRNASPAVTIGYREYLTTYAWKVRRDEALQRAKHACQLCPSTSRLNVHHCTYERLGYEDPTDLIVLCRRCHARHHGVLA